MRYFVLAFFLAVVATIGVAGYRGDKSRKPPIEIFPDMDRQAKLRPQVPNAFFGDLRSSQLPPSGTVARSKAIVAGNDQVYAFQESPITTGRITGTTNFVEVNPFPITTSLLTRGQERYQISCAPCHGAQGDGKGIVSKYGFATIANLHEKRISTQTDGEIFNTVSNGKNTMSGYAANVTIEDRWAIVAYLRALQLSRVAVIEDVPADKRALLKK